MASIDGYLMKQGDVGVVKGWKRRYFEMNCNGVVGRKPTLTYYDKKGDIKEKGSIDFTTVTSVTSLSESLRIPCKQLKERAYEFHITTPRRVYNLRARDEAEMNYWVQGLLAYVNKSSAPATTSPRERKNAAEVVSELDAKYGELSVPPKELPKYASQSISSSQAKYRSSSSFLPKMNEEENDILRNPQRQSVAVFSPAIDKERNTLSGFERDSLKESHSDVAVNDETTTDNAEEANRESNKKIHNSSNSIDTNGIVAEDDVISRYSMRREEVSSYFSSPERGGTQKETEPDITKSTESAKPSIERHDSGTYDDSGLAKSEWRIQLEKEDRERKLKEEQEKEEQEKREQEKKLREKEKSLMRSTTTGFIKELMGETESMGNKRKSANPAVEPSAFQHSLNVPIKKDEAHSPQDSKFINVATSVSPPVFKSPPRSPFKSPKVLKTKKKKGDVLSRADFERMVEEIEVLKTENEMLKKELKGIETVARKGEIIKLPDLEKNRREAELKVAREQLANERKIKQELQKQLHECKAELKKLKHTLQTFYLDDEQNKRDKPIAPQSSLGPKPQNLFSRIGETWSAATKDLSPNSSITTKSPVSSTHSSMTYSENSVVPLALELDIDLTDVTEKHLSERSFNNAKTNNVNTKPTAEKDKSSNLGIRKMRASDFAVMDSNDIAGSPPLPVRSSLAFFEDEDVNDESAFWRRPPPLWMKDEMQLTCLKCNSEFSWLNRKHHCRSCGRLYCDGCSSWEIICPGYDAPQRVCLECCQLIQTKLRFYPDKAKLKTLIPPQMHQLLS